MNLPFPNDTFRFVFYHHVIEHVSNPETSLAEIARVLQPNGLLYIGTPNRHRLIGYLGSYSVPISEKIKWNLADYAARIRGKFQNQLGAHAGFSKTELEAMLASKFSEYCWLTDDYLHLKYGNKLPKSILRFITWHPVIKFSAPSIYAICKK